VRERTDHVFWLGDQAAVIPSFAGDGIAIALHSARRATNAYLAGDSAASYQMALGRELRGQVSRATWVSRLLVRPWFQPLADLTARAAPSLVRAVAMGTRVAHA
jgi:flavin-dependent dehydrogenase